MMLSDYDFETLYAGYRLDGESGLYHVRFRQYHPTLGRWLQRDPVHYVDGLNVYQYVASMPTNAVDPKGLSSICTTKWQPKGNPRWEPAEPGMTFLAGYRNTRTGFREDPVKYFGDLLLGVGTLGWYGREPIWAKTNYLISTTQWVMLGIGSVPSGESGTLIGPVPVHSWSFPTDQVLAKLREQYGRLSGLTCLVTIKCTQHCTRKCCDPQTGKSWTEDYTAEGETQAVGWTETGGMWGSYPGWMGCRPLTSDPVLLCGTSMCESK